MAESEIAEPSSPDAADGGTGWTYPAPPKRWRWYHAIIVVAVAGITVMWLYAFSPLPTRTSPMRVRDSEWRSRAQALCTNAEAAINKLPAARTATSPQNRAATIDQSNQILATMVAALVGDKPSTDADVKRLAPWLVDYQQFLTDRRDYADLLRSGKDEPFSQSTNDAGGPISLKMDEFARVNDIPACKVPRDV